MTRSEVLESLEATIKKLIATTWRARKLEWSDVQQWIGQFTASSVVEDDQQVHALYLLSHFLYFDHDAVRVLLRSVFRDLYRTPIVHEIRRRHSDTTDITLLDAAFELELSSTRFLGVGNPSESGVHLLYYFRQENDLGKQQFINAYDAVRNTRTPQGLTASLRFPSIRRYVFIDDVCGSGTQARDYLKDWAESVKSLDPTIKVVYYMLFATPAGLDAVRSLGCFDEVEAIFELDESFRCLEPSARIFNPTTAPFERTKIRATCEEHGAQLWPDHPLGYKNGQMLLGFAHNTPDNTLPIFWYPHSWTPVFKRYHKA